MEKKTLAIKNISNHEVGIVVPEIRLSRFIQPNRSIKMNKEQLEEALTYPGVPELFNSQYSVKTMRPWKKLLVGMLIFQQQTKKE